MHSITQTKRRLPFLRQLLLLLLLITAAPAFALTFIVDDLTYQTSGIDGEVSVSRCDPKVTNVAIPPEVEYQGTTYRVTSIGDLAFAGCPLSSISIPNSVTSIGKAAYSGCTLLSSISIPGSVTSIGDQAFWGCTDLTSVTLPNSLTFIPNGAFARCLFLSSITIPDSVTSIGEAAFAGCFALSSVTIPDSVISIGDGAFAFCLNMTEIEVKAGNTKFASVDGVLYNKEMTTLLCCPGGKSEITIPNTVTTIGEAAFCLCVSLTSVTIPNNVTTIGETAFCLCGSLTSVTIPDSVISIGDGAFFECAELTSLTLPESVKELGSDCFAGCTLRPLKILSKEDVTFSDKTFSEMGDGSEIYCYAVNYDRIYSLLGKKGRVFKLDNPAGTSHPKP